LLNWLKIFGEAAEKRENIRFITRLQIRDQQLCILNRSINLPI